jgi:hypothetical protein
MKDTISMPRYSTAEIDFVAIDPGETLFHCHHQDHMDEGFAGLITMQAKQTWARPPRVLSAEMLASISVPDSVNDNGDRRRDAIDEVRRFVGGLHPASGLRLVAGARHGQ